MTENELISVLIPTLAVNDATILGAGDDCAIIDVGLDGHWLLLKTDAVVANVHFTQDAAPEQVGHKALARCLSDIAAMGGKPSSAVITLALPRNFDSDWIQRLYAGLNATARRHGVAIVGGETTSNPDRLLLSVALLGTVAKKQCCRRAGARSGDAILVTGELGGSITGRHLTFEPRLREAAWLASQGQIHAMIDVSDGIASDLRHILTASQAGAELDAMAIPISRSAQCAANNSPQAPLWAALTDGEDYELLFTVSSQDAGILLDSWKQQFPDVRLTRIGGITDGTGLRLRYPDRVVELSAHGYEHFA